MEGVLDAFRDPVVAENERSVAPHRHDTPLINAPVGSLYSSGQPSNESHSFLQSRSTPGSSSLVSGGNDCALTHGVIEPRGNDSPMCSERDRITSSGWLHARS